VQIEWEESTLLTALMISIVMLGVLVMESMEPKASVEDMDAKAKKWEANY